MKEYYGNHLGICINNQDPEYRGRVQIFIPHIMPALYEGWNQEGQDITIECVGNNLPNGLNSAIIERLKQILPWAEGAMPIVGASVGGQYNSATGNFNQTMSPEGLNPAASYSGSIGVTGSGKIDKSQFLGYLEQRIASSKLNNYVPSDGAKYGIDGSPASWANYFYHLSNRESAHNVNTVGDIGKFVGNSNGLFQLSPNDAVNYGLNNGRPFTQQQLVDPVLNTNAAITITERLVLKDGAIGSNRSTGAARYWGPLRKGWTPPPRKADSNQPASAPSPGAAGTAAAAYMFPDGGPYYKQQPDQRAVTQVNTPTPVTAGSPGNLAQRAQAAAFSSGSFGAGSTSNCGKIARGVDYNILQDNYFTNSTGGNSRGSANVSVPYWVRSGYYQVETAIPDKIPFGSKIVFAVGQGDAKNSRTGSATNGHVTTVGDNGALFGSIAGESFAKYNNLRGDQKVTILTPTQKYRDRFKQLYGTDLPEYASSGVTSGAGKVPIDDGGSDTSSTIFPNPSPTQFIPTDVAGIPAGNFAIPGPGAMLWVFFREGNPMFPVYFAASYGINEWQNAYQANGQPSDYGLTTVQSSGPAGATITINNLENPCIRNQAFNGSYTENDLYGRKSYVNGNNEAKYDGSWNLHTNGRQFFNLQDDIHNVLGNTRTIVGNPSQENFDKVEQQLKLIKEINQPMLEGGSNDPSKQQSQIGSTASLTL